MDKTTFKAYFWGIKKPNEPIKNSTQSLQFIDKPKDESTMPPVKVSTNPICSSPNQPNATTIKTQIHGKKTLSFQPNWYAKFSWLHFDPSGDLDKVMCFTCIKATEIKLVGQGSSFDSRVQETFTKVGFANWKKALEKFKEHETSMFHRVAQDKLKTLKETPILSQLSQHVAHDRKMASDALYKIITSLRFLLEEGIALRGKTPQEGKFIRLLQLRSEDNENLCKWLGRKISFTSPEIQNEIIDLMSNSVLRGIIDQIKTAKYFGVICDGTQDITGTEQESICIRYVDPELNVKEVFVGVYSTSVTTGHAIAEIMKDVVLRLTLSIEDVRAQTYDGASNMSGQYKGCQAEIKRCQPLALYVHCGAHITHLITCKGVAATTFIRNALDCVQELGNVYKQSGHFKTLYLNLNSEEREFESPSSLKPICPTRWLTRLAAVRSVLDNYGSIISSLERASKQFGQKVAARCSGLLKIFQDPKTLLGLKACLKYLHVLESFNKALQGSNQTVHGMLSLVHTVESELTDLRTEEVFHEVYVSIKDDIETYDLDDFVEPRKRKVNGVSRSSEDIYRAEYFMMLDTAIRELDDSFSSTDLNQYIHLSNVFLSGIIDPSLINKYPELNTNDLKDEFFFYVNNTRIVHH